MPRVKSLIEVFYNKEKDSYGPFEGQDVVDFLSLVDEEIKGKKLVNSWLNDKSEGVLKSNEDIGNFLNNL